MEKTITLRGKLSLIQDVLHAPKGQKNTFGKYNYRSCEDIFKAVKPHLKEHGVVLTVGDELVMIGERYYIKATAILRDTVTDETITNVAYAREELTKKGMDGSQITGTASSYARKYALNGLFNIDDTKDSDATNEHGKGKTTPAKGKATTGKAPTKPARDPKLASEAQINMIKGLCKGSELLRPAVLQSCKVKTMDEITVASASKAIKWLQEDSALWLEKQSEK
jgi:hypothetical protein